MNYTSIEQSKKLLELGLNPESADMEYLAIKEDGKLVGDIPFVKDDSEVEDSAYSHIYDRIPCWSATKLLDLLPNIIKRGKEMRNWYWFNLNREPYQISYGNSFGSSGEWCDMVSSPQRDDLVDACYDMVVYLIENKCINANEL